ITGQSSWPSAGHSLATYGQLFMAAYKHYLQTFRKYWRSILTVLSVCAGAALVFTFLQTPKVKSLEVV
uniref:hypothetical protein n=1 Tax=uncultured Micrococcus sp. TaxID=114051 RepID=UPI00261C11DD